MKSIAALINELETKLPFIDQKKESVSGVPVGWHLEHSLLALIRMISSIEHSDPADYKRKFNFRRSLVLTLGRIPRGRGKAPDAAKPGELISNETIRPLLEKARQKAEILEKLGNDKFYNHPVFGNLKMNQARRIIAIHTLHHIKIINDIIAG